MNIKIIYISNFYIFYMFYIFHKYSQIFQTLRNLRQILILWGVLFIADSMKI